MSAISPEDAAVLRTPILDSELQELLHRITDEGGYTFASMAARAGAGDGRAAEVARELAWEQLHSGPWHSVMPVWRDAYAMACLYAAKHHYAAGEFRPALRALDMGLIMGGFTLREDLNLCIGKVTAALRGKEISDNGGGVRKDELYRDFNLAEVDLDNIDGEQSPKILDLEFLDCILEEGEMLYIPPKWWHYVRSLTTSFSVSFWWSDQGSGNSNNIDENYDENNPSDK